MPDSSTRLADILALPEADRVEPLLRLAGDTSSPQLVAAIAAVIDGGYGDGRARHQLGAALGRLGDPRLRSPGDPDYWADVTFEEGGPLRVGRFLVTTAEFRAWIAAGGYHDDAHWSPEGLAWRAGAAHTWTELADAPDAAHLVVPNHPVAGPTFWEAEAYAAAHGARLLTVDEHRTVMRGAEKRPYPWGAPFIDGYANTREEALGGPSAVGLYRNDVTSEGIYDLAGNMGEWLADAAGEQRVTHPGSWARPSMATWAKAIELVGPGERSADLSFRLARNA